MIEIQEKITPPLSGASVETINDRIRGALDRESIQALNGATNYRTAPSGYGTNYRTGGSGGNIYNSKRQAVPQSFESQMPEAERRQENHPVQSSEPVRNSSIPPRPENYSQIQPAISRAGAAEQRSQPAVTAGLRLPEMTLPVFTRPLQKGQKSPIDPMGGVLHKIRASFGWNLVSSDYDCDIDASAFLVDASGKVPSDSWFVFYGQTKSPDESVSFGEDYQDGGRESIPVDLDRLSPEIQKIVFVLTIHEAFERKQNFSMVKDAYVRLMNAENGKELLSFRMDQYYENVTSMTIGEIYLHHGQWKFNPVGNGVHQDLAGQCAIYGVDIEG